MFGWVSQMVHFIPTSIVAKHTQVHCTYIQFGLSPLPVTVTTRIITLLVGDPYKPSFATVTGRGDNPMQKIKEKQYYVIRLSPKPSPRQYPSPNKAHDMPLTKQNGLDQCSLGIQSPCQMMLGVYNHLLRKVFRIHYHSQVRWVRIPRDCIALVIRLNFQHQMILAKKSCSSWWVKLWSYADWFIGILIMAYYNP